MPVPNQVNITSAVTVQDSVYAFSALTLLVG